MNLKTAFFLLLLQVTLSSNVSAQTGDPWIYQAYKELYNRQPSSAELNIKNYNDGSWRHYDDLKRYVAMYQSSIQPKGDPWILQIYKESYGRQPNPLELNIKNYNGGSWNNYGELQQYIKDFQSSLKVSGITFSTAFVSGLAVVGIKQNGTQIAVAAVSLNAGQIIAADGASIVAGGAGNIVAGGAGNIVAGGAGNLIANDGSSIAINKNMGGVSFGSSYTLQSESNSVVKSGKGSLIVSRK